jgi:hypothetical protein
MVKFLHGAAETHTEPAAIRGLYGREIHFKIETFWNGGFEVALVDPVNGYMVGGNAKTFDKAVHWLVEHAENHLADMLEKEHLADQSNLAIVSRSAASESYPA